MDDYVFGQLSQLKNRHENCFLRAKNREFEPDAGSANRSDPKYDDTYTAVAGKHSLKDNIGIDCHKSKSGNTTKLSNNR